MTMMNEPEYGSYGEFDAYGTADWTEKDWADYDAYVAREIDEFYAETSLMEDFIPDFGEPPF